MAGASKTDGNAIAGRLGTGCFASKNDLASSVAGVTGVAGPLLSRDEPSLLERLRKLRSIVEKSESFPVIEPAVDDERLRISGAVKAWTLVVEINSVGREMRVRLIVPWGYRTLFPR
jgi:hypothetical protein